MLCRTRRHCRTAASGAAPRWECITHPWAWPCIPGYSHMSPGLLVPVSVLLPPLYGRDPTPWPWHSREPSAGPEPCPSFPSSNSSNPGDLTRRTAGQQGCDAVDWDTQASFPPQHPSLHPGASQNTPEPWACSRGCLGAAVPTCSITPPLCCELLCCAEHSTAHWCHQWAWLGRPACSTPSAAPTKSPPTMPGCVCEQPQSNTAKGSGAPPEHSAYVPHLGSLTGDLAQSSCFGILLRYHAWGPC